MPAILRTPDGSLAIFRLGTICLITFLSITSQYFVLIPWFRQTSLRHMLLHFVPFNFGIFLIYWTFYLVCQDPGTVDKGYLPPDDVDIRYCRICDCFKPPRTHHCKTCKRCVLRMDHHCPWISTCVGYHNHAAFIKFMLCVVPTTGYLAIMMAIRLWAVFLDPTQVSTDTQTILFAAANWLGAAGVCLMVYCLAFYQLWNISENITTIESWTLKRTKALIRRGKMPRVEFPYDLYSIKLNLKEILGYHFPLLWLWPPYSATGSGHSFPINDDADPLQPWPPKKSPAILYQGQETSAARAPAGSDAGSKDKTPGVRQRSASGFSKVNSSLEDDDADFTYEDYARMGLIQDSDSEDGYVDDDGEDLDSYGVDDEDEKNSLDEVLEGGTTVAQLLKARRAEQLAPS